MAYSPKEWEIVRAFYERGLSLADIVAREEVSIKSKSQISKRASKEGWIKSEKEKLLSEEIAAKQSLRRINEQKETLKETEVTVHNTLVDEATKRMEWLNTANMLLAKTVVQKVQADGVKASYQELSVASATLGRTKDNVFGKAPDTAIQINNGRFANVPIRIPTADEVRAINESLENEC